MSYDVIEKSSYEAQPVELYVFIRGTEIFRYTTAQDDQLITGQIYEDYNIKRAKIEQNQDIGKNPVQFDSEISLPFVQQYIGTPPTDVIDINILRYHETDDIKETIIFWIGRVINVKFTGDNVEIQCEPIFTSLKRPTLRRLYQVACPHLLYGPLCTVDETSFKVTANLSSVNGTTIKSATFATQPNNYFTGGYVTWEINNVKNKRFILTHTGDTLVLNLPFPGITALNNIDVYPGCDHSLTTCASKFSNNINYGGFPSLPEKNPFSGSPVF